MKDKKISGADERAYKLVMAAVRRKKTSATAASEDACHPDLIRNWKRGKSRPTHKSLVDLAGVLEIDKDLLLRLMFGDDGPTLPPDDSMVLLRSAWESLGKAIETLERQRAR